MKKILSIVIVIIMILGWIFSVNGFGEGVANMSGEVGDGFFFVCNHLSGNMFYLFATLHDEKYLVGSIFFSTFVKLNV